MSEYMLQWDVIDWKQVKWCGEHYFLRTTQAGLSAV